MWPFKQTQQPAEESWLSDCSAEESWLTDRHLAEGILVLGGTGGGKSSGPLNAITRYALKRGFGILWMVAKPEEWDRCKGLCEEMGREVIRFSPDGPYRLNPLDCMAKSPGGVVAVGEFFRIKSELGGRKANDPFWDAEALRMLQSSSSVIFHAYDSVTYKWIYEMLSGIPQDAEAVRKPEFRDTFYGKTIALAVARHGVDPMAMELSYLMEELPEMPDRTRSNVLSHAMQLVYPSLVGPLAHLHAETNITPDVVREGKILYLDFATLTYREQGRSLQNDIKLVTQMSFLQKPDPENQVIIMADEAQEFLTKRFDSAFQAVARSAGASSVWATQNIPLITSTLGTTRDETLSLIPNYNTLIFCSNACTETNALAQQICGQFKELFTSGSSNMSGFDVLDDAMGMGQPLMNLTFSEQLQFQVKTSDIARLKRGGPENNYEVEALVCESGRGWRKMVFKQK